MSAEYLVHSLGSAHVGQSAPGGALVLLKGEKVHHFPSTEDHQERQ